jgi:hypothetical protein
VSWNHAASYEVFGRFLSCFPFTSCVGLEIGITALLKPVRWWPNQKRKFKRKIGYESNTGRLLRVGLPKPGGCLVVFVGSITMVGLATLVR